MSCTQGEESMKKIMLIAPIIHELRASWVSSAGTNLSGFSIKSHTLCFLSSLTLRLLFPCVCSSALALLVVVPPAGSYTGSSARGQAAVGWVCVQGGLWLLSVKTGHNLHMHSVDAAIKHKIIESSEWEKNTPNF